MSIAKLHTAHSERDSSITANPLWTICHFGQIKEDLLTKCTRAHWASGVLYKKKQIQDSQNRAKYRLANSNNIKNDLYWAKKPT